MRQSLLHNYDFALVLNHNSGIVSQQLHVLYDPLFATTKDFDSFSLWQVIAGLFRRAGHTLSCADRAAKRVSLSPNPSQKEGGKRS